MKTYVAAAMIGALIGVFILAPSYEYIYAMEYKDDPLSSFEYVIGQIGDIFTGNLTEKNLVLFYAEIGAVLGLMSLWIYRMLNRNLQQSDALKSELDKNLPSIIRQGEGPLLEFKSTLRWDLQENRVNRSLETVILKTLSGFFNSHIGGTLLIGVADNGELIGLEKDYQTLKKPNKDGFEQALMTTLSTNLGADLCPFVHVLFHVVDGKDICRVIVSPANRPVFLSQGNAQKFYVRTGSGTRDLNIQEALDYVSSRWKQHAG